MKAWKVKHRDVWRIRIDFPYDPVLSAQIKKIKDARWSKTMKAWHIPYTKEAFTELKTAVSKP
jgi:integrase/recombinase XerD